ncbi:phosphoesterase, partial [Streptomyces lasiicapitis]
MSDHPASRVRRLLRALDHAAFEKVATRSWPGAERALPRLSRGANHVRLWVGVAGGLWGVWGATVRQ